ncbi:MAG: heparinase II/III family protein [Sedimentisphaeraceae bacterium JB056]
MKLRTLVLVIFVFLLIFKIDLNAEILNPINIDGLRHPYILFDHDDIEELRDRSVNQPWKGIWDNINASAAKDTDGVANAFIYAVTGDIKRGEAAKKELMELCALKSWSENKPPKLQVSEKCRPAGLMYDMIYDLLTDQERDAISRKIVDAGILPLYKHSFIAWWSQRRQHNYSPTFASGWGIAAMAVLKERPDAVEWIDRAAMRVKLFMNSQGESGGYGEGVNYCNMSLRSIMPFMDGVDNVFGVDLYENNWLREQVPLFLIYCLSPDRRSTLNFNDAGINRIYDPHVMLRLAGRGAHQQIAWIVSQDIIGGQSTKATVSFDWPGFGGNNDNRASMKGPGDIFSFLWLEPDAGKASLTELERSKFFKNTGWSVFRSGWQRQDLQLGVISSPKFFGNHGHADRGSFIFNAYGERLIADSGKPTGYDDPITVEWFRESISHNVMLVNGQGQQKQDKLPHGGRMKSFISTPAFDYVVTENAGPYGEMVDKWNRHVIFAMPEFAILLDDVELPQAGDVEFRFHSPSSHKIKLQGDAAYFPGDNGRKIPTIPDARKSIEMFMNEKYPQWWQSGKPMHEMVDWTGEDEDTTDLELRTFSKSECKRSVVCGYQDYRFPSTYLSQTYEDITAGQFVTVMYPRSSEMKSDDQLPVIEEPNINTIKIQRDNKNWNILRGQTKQKFSTGDIKQNATLSVVAYEDELFKGFMIIDGTLLRIAESYEFVSDMPVTVAAAKARQSMSFSCEVENPNGTDLRIKFPDKPRKIMLNGSDVWGCVTDTLLEIHVAQGQNTLSVEF